MEKKEVKTLTVWQEMHILRELYHSDFMACGSSRIVYRCPNTIVQYLGLDVNDNYVIKLAVGRGGFVQNMHEAETYNDYKDWDVFADIVAAGHFILIMEAIDECDYRDFAESIYSDDDPEERADNFIEYEYDDDCSEENRQRLINAAKVIISLAEIYGCTSDNGQLGITADGRLVAYDYGFYAAEGCSRQCSNDLVDNCCDLDVLTQYLEELVDTLQLMSKVEEKLDLLNHVSLIEDDINEEHNCR